jgi:hypothetical protein
VGFLTTSDEAGVARKAHQGVCHRCGWRGAVVKVRRRDRKLMKTGRAFGRLCHECTEELLHIRKTSEPARAAGQGNLKSARHRRVA